MTTQRIIVPQVLQDDDKDAGESVVSDTISSLMSDFQEERASFVLRDVAEGIRLLNTIAQVDNAAYHSSLNGGSSIDNEGSGIISLQQSLERIVERLRLHDDEGSRNIGGVVESIQSLSQSISRFHSHLYTLKAESDKQTTDLLQQMTNAQDLEVCNRQMAIGLYKLHQKNKHLSTKLKSLKRNEQTLLRRVEISAKRIECLEESQKELQVLAHEHVLMSPALLTSSSKPRARIDTDSTVHSTTAPESESVDNSDSISSTLESTSLGDDNDSFSVDSFVPPPLAKSIFGEPTIRWSSLAPEDSTVTLDFPVASEIGIIFKELPVQEDSKKTKGSLTTAFLQFENSGSDSMLSAHCPVESADRRYSSFLDRFHVDSFLGKQQPNSGPPETALRKSTSSIDANNRKVFVVSGYTDAYDVINHGVKPMIGSRIVSINGEDVPENWTLADFLRSVNPNAITDKDSSSQNRMFSKITFRSDPWTVAQYNKMMQKVDQDRSQSELQTEKVDELTDKKKMPVASSQKSEDVTNQSAGNRFGLNFFNIKADGGATATEANVSESKTEDPSTGSLDLQDDSLALPSLDPSGNGSPSPDKTEQLKEKISKSLSFWNVNSSSRSPKSKTEQTIDEAMQLAGINQRKTTQKPEHQSDKLSMMKLPSWAKKIQL